MAYAVSVECVITVAMDHCKFILHRGMSLHHVISSQLAETLVCAHVHTLTTIDK